MLTCEIKINGRLIHHIYIRNMSDPVLSVDESKTPYLYEIYTPEEPLCIGKIVYDRGMGAMSLINKVLSKILKKKGMKNL